MIPSRASSRLKFSGVSDPWPKNPESQIKILRVKILKCQKFKSQVVFVSQIQRCIQRFIVCVSLILFFQFIRSGAIACVYFTFILFNLVSIRITAILCFDWYFTINLIILSFRIIQFLNWAYDTSTFKQLSVISNHVFCDCF